MKQIYGVGAVQDVVVPAQNRVVEGERGQQQATRLGCKGGGGTSSAAAALKGLLARLLQLTCALRFISWLRARTARRRGAWKTSLATSAACCTRASIAMLLFELKAVGASISMRGECGEGGHEEAA